MKLLGLAISLQLLPLSSVLLANDEAAAAFAGLKEGSSDERVEKALEYFKASAEKAFPFLLQHLNDNDLASSKHFQKEVLEISPRTGPMAGP